MSRLNELIQQYCPDGVEYKKLGDVCDIKGRIGFRGYTRQDLVEEADGAITLSPSNIINQELNYEDCSYISWAKYEESPEIKVAVGDVIFTKTASVGKTALVKYLPKEATINPQLVVLKNIQCNSAFLAYVLKTYRFQKEVAKLQGVGSVPNISQTSLSGITIPIPPLPVQEEIVRILDSFTELQAELQAELQKRLQQYNYYRDKLLSFNELNRWGQSVSVEWKKLGEICLKVCSGGTPSRGNSGYFTGDIPWLRTQEVDWKDIYDTEIKITEDAVKNSSAKLIPENCVIIAMYGATAGKVGINKIPLTTNQACCNLQINPQKALYKYVYYWVCNEYEHLKSLGQGSQNNINAQIIKEYPIPIPPLAEQQRIVDILDRFDKLTTDITAGLPAEIEARRKQYEYYRDQLLTFKQKA